MRSLKVFISILIAMIFSEGIHAQQFNLSPAPFDGKMSIGLKVNKPIFKKTEYGNYYSGASGIYKVYGYFTLKNNWQINTEVPLVISSSADYDETGLGNIYVEILKALNTSSSTWLAFGVYLPTIGKENYDREWIGILSDPYHFVQYMEGISISSTFGYNLADKPGPVFGADIGPDLYIPTFEEGDVELLLHYGIKAGYRFNSVATWAELNGIMILTEEGSLADRWINQMNLGAQWSQGIFRPGIFYGIHLDKNFREGISGILGVNLQVVLD
jgi:hypothetical protein